MIIFLLPPIIPPLIFATVIPIPDASMPDSEIVTPPPTTTEELVVIPVECKLCPVKFPLPKSMPVV